MEDSTEPSIVDNFAERKCCEAYLESELPGSTRTRCARTDDHDGSINSPHRARRNRRFYEWWPDGYRRGRRGE